MRTRLITNTPRILAAPAALTALVLVLILAPIVLLVLAVAVVLVTATAVLLGVIASSAAIIGPTLVIHAAVTIAISIGPPASSHVTHQLITTLPATGPVAQDTNGNIYVATEEGIKVFNIKNELTETFGKEHLEGTNPLSITITNNNGNIYVGESHSIFGANDGILVFNNKHEYQTTLHIPDPFENTAETKVAADNSNPPDSYNGDIYTSATVKITGGSIAGRLYRLTPTGTLLNYTATEPYIENNNAITGEVPGQNEFTGVRPLAVAPNGTVYAEGEDIARTSLVDMFADTGEYMGAISGPPQEAFREVTGISVDPMTGHLLVIAVAAGGQACSLYEYDTSGAYIGQRHLGALPCGGVASIGNVAIGGPRVGVSVLGPDVVTPTVVTEASSGVGAKSAVVEGSVNPEGGGDSSLDARARFEYGLSTSYGAAVGAVQGGGGPSPGSSDVGFGNAVVPVQAQLEGLEPNATYHYRAVGMNENGSETGEDETFVTPPALPDVDGQSVSAVTSSSAILNAEINPNNEDTRYRFVYGMAGGASASTSVGDVGSGFGDVSIGQEVSGLAPGTVYRYKVLAAHGVGEPAAGIVEVGEGSFETLSLPVAPVVVTGIAEGMSQGSVVLEGLVDARGSPTMFEFDLGTDTSYGVRIFGDGGQAVGPVEFRVPAQNLQPGTTYHFRLVASNANGTTYGGDVSFTTPMEPGSMIAQPSAPPLIATPLLTFPTGIEGQHHSEPKKHKKRVVKHKKRKASKKKRMGKAKRSGRGGVTRGGGR